MKKILALLLLVPALAWASSAKTPLDHAPVNLHDRLSLQRGAQVFVNHCLNCHSASAMRYSRLGDLGLTEGQIRDNLLFTGEKVGESMVAATDPLIAKAAFGVVPPDLSLVGRSRGSDWLIAPLTPCSADTFRRPTCLRTQPELLQTLAPLSVSRSLAEMSPRTSVRKPPSSFVRSFTRMSVLGSE